MARRIRPIIKNHTIKKFIAEGGMAEVWHAVNKLDGRQTAIKILHPQHKNNKTIETLFQKEAKVMAKVSGHSGIIDYYTFVEKEQSEDGRPYMIMEYAKGKTIDEYIKYHTGPITEHKLIPLFAKILDALEYAHNKKIVHRDIKPGNIIITDEFDEYENPKIKLIDFGIAKNTDKNQKILTALRTKIGTKMGTIWYMSPEAVRESSNIDKLTDIYALGVTLFQMATGKIPFKADESEFDVQNKIVNVPFPDARTVYPHVSEHINNIIQRATQKDKNDRYQSCAEFKHDLMGATPPPPPIDEEELINTIAHKTAGLSNDKKITAKEKKFYQQNKSKIDETAKKLKDQAKRRIAKKKVKNKPLTKLENSFYKLNETIISNEESKIKEEENNKKKRWRKIRKRLGISAIITVVIVSLYLLSGGGTSLFISAGDNLYKQEDFNSARKKYYTAIDFPAIMGNIYLKRTEARLKIGNCYYQTGDLALAKTEYTKVSKSSTKYTGDATFKLAKIFYKEGNITAAETQIEKYQNLPSYQKKVSQSEEYLIKGLIYAEKKEWGNAYTMFNSMSPNYIKQKTNQEKREYLATFGQSSYYNEKYSDAVTQYNKFFDLDGEGPWHRYMLAKSNYHIEQYTEAIKHFSKIIESSAEKKVKQASLKGRGDAKYAKNKNDKDENGDGYCADYKILKQSYSDNSRWKQYCYTAPVSNSRTTNTNRIFYDFFTSTDEDYQGVNTTSTTGGYSGKKYYVMKQKVKDGNQFSWEYLRNGAGNKYTIPSNLTRVKTTVKFKLGPFGVFYFAFKSASNASEKSYVLTLYEDANNLSVNFLKDNKWGTTLENRSLDIVHNKWYTLTVKRTNSTYSFYLDDRFLFSTTCKKNAGSHIAWGVGGTHSNTYEQLTLDYIQIFKH